MEPQAVRVCTRFMQVCMLFLLVFVTACSSPAADSAYEAVDVQPVNSGNNSVTLVLGAYSVARDALQPILPAFQAEWKEKTGQTVEFQQSYEASGTQARSIASGMEADVALLAMEGDIDKLVDAELIPHDWKQRDPYQGMVTRSIAVIGTRAGNPLHIKDWMDLTRSDVDVLYPNPKTSGGAQWDINAIYGAGLKMAAEQGVDGPNYAKQLLHQVHDRVISMDKSGRASMAAFEYGVGDAIVTYENELKARVKQGVDYEIIVPKHTIRIENPVVIVDRYVDKHGTREVAEAFVEFLRSEKAQQLWVEAGFRPVNEQVEAKLAGTFIEPAGLFTIDDLGGWDEVRNTLYSRRGIWYEVLAGINRS
ncbi:sulfate ABC transporter substrate-binding protein [Paenibacillus arenosi]|nr:sulfate ABC transporter substrate-binding protein [Paenibacillus arenosi]